MPISASTEAASTHNLRDRLRHPAVWGSTIGVLALIASAALVIASGLLTPTVSVYASRDLEVKDAASSAGVVVGHLRRGDRINGKWTDSRPVHARWLRVSWPGAKRAFIWGHAVSLKPRPELAQASQSFQTAALSSLVYAEPDRASPVIDNLVSGEAAVVDGALGGDWIELTLANGGVGYVPAATFAGPPEGAGLAGVAHYTCKLSTPDSVNPPRGTPNLDFYLDGSRQCLNHRYVYVADETGGLKRVLFNDKERRASLLYFAGDRKSFTRNDYQLAQKDYEHLSKDEGALAALECAAPGDAGDAAAQAKALSKLTPTLGPRTVAQSMIRRVWTCSTAG